MIVRKFDRSLFEEFDDGGWQGLLPWDGITDSPFIAGWATVSPSMEMEAHQHHELEVYLVTQGTGVVRSGENREEVGPGDVIFMPPFTPHTLKNHSVKDELVFLSLLWEDKARLEKRADEKQAEAEAGRAQKRNWLITYPSVTPNGELHLGHLAGPYLGGDVVGRYLAMQGHQVFCVGGTDDHHTLVHSASKKVGTEPEDFAQQVAEAVEEGLAAAEVTCDLFLRSGSPEMAAAITAMFVQLYEKGDLFEKESIHYFCEPCDHWLSEGRLVGSCPGCGAETIAYVCEDCGRHVSPEDMKEPRCSHCDAPPVERKVRCLYFSLADHVKGLEGFWERVSMNPLSRAVCEKSLEEGLGEHAITQPDGYGIPVPIPGYEDQTFTSIVHVVPLYLEAARRFQELTGKKVDEVVQLFGTDNSFWATLFDPALWKMAQGEDAGFPSVLLLNEFLSLDSRKFSTMSDHRILVRDFLANTPVDEVRFGLAYDRPENSPTNFTVAGYDTLIAEELIGSWQGWLTGLAETLEQGFGGKVPATGYWTEPQRVFHDTLNRLTEDAARAYDPRSYSLRSASRVLCEIVRRVEEFRASEVAWKAFPKRDPEWRNAIALEALAAKVLAQCAYPLMPRFATRLWVALGFDGESLANSWEPAPWFVPPGQEVSDLGQAFFTGRPT